jgi:hypothetical protein
MAFEVHRSTNNIKRRPDDSLIEGECARFKVSEKDFGIVELPGIERWMTINPAVQYNFHQSEESALKEMAQWQEKIKDAIIADFIEMPREENNPSTTPIAESYVAGDGSVKTDADNVITGAAEQNTILKAPEEIEAAIKMLKDLVPDRFPGRTPTVSLLNPAGGIWTTTKSRTVSSIQPILCPTARFDLDTPQLHYQLSDKHYDGTQPSLDAASHTYFYAGLEFIGAVLTISFRVRKREDINLLTDGELLLNDLNVADFILGRILDDGAWKNHSEPFVAALGRVNSVLLFRDFEQLQDCLNDQFFVGFGS